MFIKSVIFVITFAAIASAVRRSYEGYKVYKLTPNTEEHVEILKHVQKLGLGEFWDENIAMEFTSRVMVSKENQGIFLSQMKAAKIEITETIANLQKTIEDQLKSAEIKSRNPTENFLGMTWDKYHSLEDIYSWLSRVVETYPDIVSSALWGLSNENREIRGIVLDYRMERENNLIAVIEGTLHAREWITPATVTWIIKEFLTSNDEEVRAMARSFQWHILPVANPDGYVYTFESDRMWRKNRNTNYYTNCPNANNDMSNGVDLNRNFDFVWNSIGASSNPCSNTFAGSSAFSEPESRAIRTYVQNLNVAGEMIYYLAFHSFTQLVVIPYSHFQSPNDVLQSGNFANMFEIGARAAAKLEERFGTHYRVGAAAEVLYPMSGTSFDWVKNATNIPISYLIELRDLGEHGFLLPAEQIIPNNLEIMDFLVEMDKTTRILGYYERSGATTVMKSLFVLVICVLFTMN